MDFTISRDDLLAVIDKCQLATDDKSPSEEFTVMTVDASKKKTVRFAAVGQYCSVDTVAPAEVKTTGVFHVKPKHLRSIATSMPQGKIQLSLKGERVTVKSLVSSRKASFQNHTLTPFKVEDPGEGAAWIKVDSQELVRAVAAVSAAATWHGRADPNGCLLVPTERGLSLFGCNMYLLARVDTSIRVEGKPIVLPATASDVLALMAPDDADVSLFSDGQRVFLENADTLVSAPLFDYKFLSTYQMFWDMLANPQNLVGPAVSLPKLTQGVKAVLRCGVFEGEKERDSTYGTTLHLKFGETASVSLDLAAADAEDEFEVVRDGAEIDCLVSSRLFEQMLTSFGSTEEVQVLLANNDPTIMLLLRTQGLTYGLMTKEKR